MIRLDKYLTDCAIGTRSEVKKLIRAGKVEVNGSTDVRPEMKLDELKDHVIVNKTPVVYEKYGYYLFHKPAGCVTATKDSMHKTVMDYFDTRTFAGYSPVGRLDMDTEGFLLVTNDGALAHHLISPAHHVPKTYYVETDGPVPASAVELFDKGIDIGDDTLTLPAELAILQKMESDDNSAAKYAAEVTVYEGRYHQVKRMFQAIGRKVVYLKRISMGGLSLGLLPKGEYRKLTEAEVELISSSNKGE